MVTLVTIAVWVITVLVLLLLGCFFFDRNPIWPSVNRRAGELLHAVLTSEQYWQMFQKGYVDIPSPSNPQRVYRVPQFPGRVQMRENGQLKTWLCLQPIEWVPNADLVVIHKLMIEADEEIYLQKANHMNANP